MKMWQSSNRNDVNKSKLYSQRNREKITFEERFLTFSSELSSHILSKLLTLKYTAMAAH